jgi:hypothetical protein
MELNMNKIPGTMYYDLDEIVKTIPKNESTGPIQDTIKEDPEDLEEIYSSIGMDYYEEACIKENASAVSLRAACSKILHTYDTDKELEDAYAKVPNARKTAVDILGEYLHSDYGAIILHETIPGFDVAQNIDFNAKSVVLNPYFILDVRDQIEGFFKMFMRIDSCVSCVVAPNNTGNEYYAIIGTDEEANEKIYEHVTKLYMSTKDPAVQRFCAVISGEIGMAYDKFELDYPFAPIKDAWADVYDCEEPFIGKDRHAYCMAAYEIIKRKFRLEASAFSLKFFTSAIAQCENDKYVFDSLLADHNTGILEEDILIPRTTKLLKLLKKYVPIRGTGNTISKYLTAMVTMQDGLYVRVTLSTGAKISEAVYNSECENYHEYMQNILNLPGANTEDEDEESYDPEDDDEEGDDE